MQNGEKQIMKNIEIIANAGNTEVPCYLAIKALGFEFSRIDEKTDREMWVAENDKVRIVASNQLELLGLIYMRTMRGEDWKAEDDEINDYLARYYPEALK